MRVKSWGEKLRYNRIGLKLRSAYNVFVPCFEGNEVFNYVHSNLDEGSFNASRLLFIRNLWSLMRDLIKGATLSSKARGEACLAKTFSWYFASKFGNVSVLWTQNGWLGCEMLGRHTEIFMEINLTL